ncbi:MAG: hypothetical protein EBS77_01980 [Gammaproteobacteria bacterium]|nr:hypothetical protein [Gammaproteobacteria bacterium]
MQVTITTLGVFRTLGPEFVLDIADGATVFDVRQALESRIAADAPSLLDTLARSAFAADDFVLRDDDLIDGASVLALLPPVAGG